MAWGRVDDTFNAWDCWMKATELAAQRGDDRLVLELKGACSALYTYSAQQWTDYEISYGAAIVQLGMSHAERLIADLIAIGLLTDISEGETRRFKLLERKDKWNNIRSDEKKHSAKRKRDQNRASLQVPVMLRDGDQCRYCGGEVVWGDTRSDAGREYDHINIDEETTAENYVVACRGCNQLRHDLGQEANIELPLLPAPDEPIYGPKLLERLAKWPPTVARFARQMGIPNPLTGSVEAHTDPATSRATDTQPPSTQPSGLPATQAGKAPQLPAQDSHQVESQGRAAQEVQTRRASSSATTAETLSIHRSMGLSVTQAERDPQHPSKSHVRDLGAAKDEPQPSARKRRRRRR
ncbi:hypothetical protein SFC07_11110 [Corynebacterium callunae]|uniref:HNH endonuclease n=1 Tax=Corynebacterium callunae TaxID=1721 RepID=UPI00398279FA